MRREQGSGFGFSDIIIVILMIVMSVSSIALIGELGGARRQRQIEDNLAQLASEMKEIEFELPERPHMELEIRPPQSELHKAYEPPMDFALLRERNPDTVGWIRIPDTRIDYPIVQSTDNEKYLHTDFDGNESVYGAVYLDCDSKADFSGWNNPLYGHHMKDGSMFKDVVKFKDENFFKEHQYFDIYTPERRIHLKAVSCYYTDSNGIVRKTGFVSQESFDEWTKARLLPCEFAELPECSVDSMFVLVTCSYEENDARTVLFAVEVDEDGQVIPATERNIPEPVILPIDEITEKEAVE